MLSDERAELTRLAGEYASAMECRTQAVVDKCELALVAYVDSLWAELTAEVERLRADAGRLDWMDEHSRRTSEIKGRPADDGDGSCSVWFVVGEPGQTLRATLDAAIKEAGNG